MINGLKVVSVWSLAVASCISGCHFEWLQVATVDCNMTVGVFL